MKPMEATFPKNGFLILKRDIMRGRVMTAKEGNLRTINSTNTWKTLRIEGADLQMIKTELQTIEAEQQTIGAELQMIEAELQTIDEPTVGRQTCRVGKYEQET
jgi:hypothetical protein